MIEVLGYLALATGIFAISRKNMQTFRWWHLTSNLMYMVYGILFDATPIFVAGLLFSILHMYHLYNIYKATNKIRIRIPIGFQLFFRKKHPY